MEGTGNILSWVPYAFDANSLSLAELLAATRAVHTIRLAAYGPDYPGCTSWATMEARTQAWYWSMKSLGLSDMRASYRDGLALCRRDGRHAASGPPIAARRAGNGVPPQGATTKSACWSAFELPPTQTV